MHNICVKCSKAFKFPYLLARHLNRRSPCSNDSQVSDSEKIFVNVDDKLIDSDIKFPVLERFDFNKLEKTECYSIILCAIRRSGKTTLIRHELYGKLKKDYDIVIFMSNSIHNKMYAFVDGIKFNDFHSEMIYDLMRFQEKCDNMFRIALIMDDLVGLNSKNDNFLLQCFCRGRNVNMTIITSSQSTTLINKNNRGNSDFVIIGNNPSSEFRETLIKSFLLGTIDIPPSVKTVNSRIDYLHKFITKFTVNNNFLILDNINHKCYQFKVKM